MNDERFDDVRHEDIKDESRDVNREINVVSVERDSNTGVETTKFDYGTERCYLERKDEDGIKMESLQRGEQVYKSENDTYLYTERITSNFSRDNEEDIRFLSDVKEHFGYPDVRAQENLDSLYEREPDGSYINEYYSEDERDYSDDYDFDDFDLDLDLDLDLDRYDERDEDEYDLNSLYADDEFFDNYD